MSHSSFPRLRLYRVGLSYATKRASTPRSVANALASSIATPRNCPPESRVTRAGLEVITATRSSPLGAKSAASFCAHIGLVLGSNVTYTISTLLSEPILLIECLIGGLEFVSCTRGEIITRRTLERRCRRDL